METVALEKKLKAEHDSIWNAPPSKVTPMQVGSEVLKANGVKEVNGQQQEDVEMDP